MFLILARKTVHHSANDKTVGKIAESTIIEQLDP